MKEILRDRMFESGSYKSHPKHITLYEALEASMDRENREEFVEATVKSCKRCRDDQDPPPPSTNSNQNKKKRQDSDTSVSKQSQAQKLRGQRCDPSSKDQLKTPEPDWVVPPNDLPEIENNWANAIANVHKDPEENKLIRKTGDMGSFIKWYCKRIRKSKLSKADLEGPTFKINLVNPEGNRVVPDVSKPLPLGGPPSNNSTTILLQ
ncbi:hypothetical protein Tco_0407858 [Tanacetum coccineum]